MTAIISGNTARGVLLRAGGAPTNWVAGPAGSALPGTGGNDAIWTPGAGGSAAGGNGDDIYHLWDTKDRVIEAAGGGIDTLVSNGLSLVLPDWVENLVVEPANASGSGNALANILAGGAGSQTLDGGAGDDILSGGDGADRFIVRAGTGWDLIRDFESGVDRVALGGGFGQFTDFAAVAAALTQFDDGTLLTLSPTDAVLFQGRSAGSFTAADFALPQASLAAGLRQTFGDEFTAFAASPTGLGPGGTATWQTTLMFGGRSLPANKDAQYYTDATVGPAPFTLHPEGTGTLDITAAPAAGLPGGLSYASGLISSETLAVQTYGLFEIRAKIVSGAGFWPAFWLLRADGTWPAELDVLESLGDAPGRVYMTSHTGSGGTRGTASAAWTTEDLSLGYHSFAVSWRPDMLRWYVDGTEVFSTATPDDMHSPMYMLANLAAGGVGSWPGPADGVQSRTMSIDLIRAWQFADLAGPVRPAALAASISASTWSADTIRGTDGDDRIEGRSGDDVMTGGGGADVFVFSAHDGRDTVTDFEPGTDRILSLGFEVAGVASGPAGVTVTFSPWHSVTLLGVAALEPGSIVRGDAPLEGTYAADLLDRSAASLPQSLSALGGADTVLGGAGDDLIAGGQGNDLIAGGAGADTFVLNAWDGHDRVLDFTPGLDRIMLRGIAPGTVWVNPSRDAAGLPGLEIDYAAGQSVFLPGLASLAEGDLVFSV